LFFGSGFTGLIYQMLWVRRFAHIMGSGSVSVSVVVAAFMGGLFLGAVLLTQLLHRCRNELRWYATLEAVIGLWGLLFVLVFPQLSGLYGWLSGLGGSGAGLVAKATFSMLLMLLPTAAMGATLPLMVQYSQRQGRNFGDAIGGLYAVNTAGGATGALLAGFFLIEFIGIDHSLYLVAAFNLAIAMGAWRMAAQDSVQRQPIQADKQVASGKRQAAPALLVAAFASGMAAIGCEVLWTRGLKFVIQSSTYSYALILSVFLLGLGMGAAIYKRRLSGLDHRVLYGRVQLALSAWVLMTISLLYGIAPTSWFQQDLLSLVYDGSHHWGLGLVTFALICVAVLLPPTMAMGVLFPTLSSLYHERTRQAPGRSVGAVFASNTIGSIAGALIVGFVLLPWIGIRGSLVGMAMVSLLLGAAFLWQVGRRRELSVGVLVCVLLSVAGLQNPHLMGRGELATDPVLFYDEGLMSTVKVYQREGHLQMSIDGSRIASTARGLRQKEQLLAHLPLLLATEAEEVLVVGLASGITAHSASLHETLRRIDVVEVVEPVFEASRYFSAYNRRIRSDPRVRLIHDDIYAWLQYNKGEYDVIVSDGKLGSLNNANTVLLSKDYYDLCRRRLRSNGIFVQWVPTITPEPELRAILRTAASSFEHLSLFYFYSSDILIVASPAPIRLDGDHMGSVFARAGVSDEMQKLDLATPAAVMSCYLGDYALQDGGIRPNTFDRPYLEFAYLRDWKQGRNIPGGYRASNMQVLVENLAGNDSASLAAAFPGLAPEVVERVLRIPALQFYGEAMANFRGGSYGRGLQAWRGWKSAVSAAFIHTEGQ
jgi:spermidine synthase